MDPAKGGRDDPPQGDRPRRPAAPRAVENARGDGLRAGGSRSPRFSGIVPRGGDGPGGGGDATGEAGGVLVRAGLHCSPNGHRALGTFPAGTVRVSPGPFTTRAEIATFLSSLRKIRDSSA